jgi:hypothetical protein
MRSFTAIACGVADVPTELLTGLRAEVGVASRTGFYAAATAW